MSTKIKLPGGRFKYTFLDNFRAFTPPGYALVDEAIDFFGDQTKRIKYLNRDAHFGDCGNIAPSTNEGPWTFLHPIANPILSPGGPTFELTDTVPEGLSGDVYPNAEAIEFRDNVWLELENLIQNEQLHTQAYFSTGQTVGISNIQLRQLLHQRQLIRSTGCFWLTNFSGMDRLVVLLIGKESLREAVENPQLPKKPKTKKKRERAKTEAIEIHRATLPIADKEVLNARLSEVLTYCLHTDVLISREGARYVVNKLIEPAHKTPNSKAWADLCKSVKPARLGQGLCKKGKRVSIVKGNGDGSKVFFSGFNAWRKT